MPECQLSVSRRLCRWTLAAALALTALLGVGACRHADLAERRLALRRQGMARSVATAAKCESWRPRRLAHTLNALRQGARRDTESSRANLKEINAYWRREWRRWRERQPAYRDRARRVLLGKPERIERHAIVLFL